MHSEVFQRESYNNLTINRYLNNLITFYPDISTGLHTVVVMILTGGKN